MEIGKKIVKYRRKNKLSQEQLAEKIGVTRQTISNWELNTTKPDVTQIKNIAKVLNTSIDDLLDNNGNGVKSKINNIENELKKNNRNLKLLILPVYFIVLILAIGIIIYYSTKKDFTDEFDPYNAFACTKKNKQENLTDTFYLYFKKNDDKTYSAIIELYQHGERCIGNCELEDGALYGEVIFDEYYAGNSLVEAVETMKYLKQGFLYNGFTCKNYAVK